MTTDWLALFDSSASLTKATKLTIVQTENPIVANVSIVRPEQYEKLTNELSRLNDRWQKALSLEQQGAFDNLSKERQERICNELMTIIRRATEIWETIEAETPELLKSLVFLEKGQ